MPHEGEKRIIIWHYICFCFVILP